MRRGRSVAPFAAPSAPPAVVGKTAEQRFHEKIATDNHIDFPPPTCQHYSGSPSFHLQAIIEGELDKRGGNNFGPPSGCRMTVFLDDVSMPEVLFCRIQKGEGMGGPSFWFSIFLLCFPVQVKSTFTRPSPMVHA